MSKLRVFVRSAAVAWIAVALFWTPPSARAQYGYDRQPSSTYAPPGYAWNAPGYGPGQYPAAQAGYAHQAYGGPSAVMPDGYDPISGVYGAFPSRTLDGILPADFEFPSEQREAGRQNFFVSGARQVSYNDPQLRAANWALQDGPGTIYEQQPYGSPTFGYGTNWDETSLQVYATPSPEDPTAGFQYSPMGPSWLKSIDIGGYVNDDQAVLTAGGVVSLFEFPDGAIALRGLATGIVHANGPSRMGYSVDLYGSRRFTWSGYEHWIKLGAFYDNQNRLHRYGIATAGVLFANYFSAPPTFDIAIGLGDGEDILGGRFREVAEEDVQVRLGLLFSRGFRAGVTGQYWHWGNPRFRESIFTAGGFAQLDLGRCTLSADVSGNDERAQGFLNLIFQPGHAHMPRQAMPVNVSQNTTNNAFTNWKTQPVTRDLALRTGEDPVERFFRRLVGNVTGVRCILRFPPRAGMGMDQNGDGVLDAGDGFEIDIAFDNNTADTATGVAIQGIAASTMAMVQGPATQQGNVGSTPVNIAPGGAAVTPAAESINLIVNAGAMAGDTIFVEFEVVADGQCARFECGPITVGSTINNVQNQARFRFVCP